MQKSFWDIVGVSSEIQTINEDSIVDAVRVAFISNKHNFYTSCWFIDIKEKFRIFRFHNIAYIAKKISNEKAEKEISSSLKAFNKLDGKAVGTKTMRIVVPKKITSSKDSNKCFLISEYLGRLPVDVRTWISRNPTGLIGLNYIAL